MATNFPPIDPNEIITLTFDFSDGLISSEVITVADLSVSVISGTDVDASTRFGYPQISGTNVLVRASNCVDDTDYHLRVKIQTSNVNKELVIGHNVLCRTS